MHEQGVAGPDDGFGSRRALLLDVAVCVALLVFSVPATMDPEVNANETLLDTILLPAVVLPVLLRRRAPLVAAMALAAGCVISAVPTFNQFRLAAAIPAGLLIAFTVASREERSRALAGLGLVLGGLAFVGATEAVLADSGGIISMVLFAFPLCAIVWFAGRTVRSRAQLAAQLAASSVELERRREQTAALAVEIERARVAGDLDAQARVRLQEMIALTMTDPSDDASARETFARIERIGRGSLNEMRGLLGLLRSDEHGIRSPRPTLEQLDALLAEARASGRLVELEVDGERRRLPAGIELAAYRAVQHALKALDADARAVVRLRYVPGALELEIRGAPAAGRDAAAALAAARERVTAQGGSFEEHHPLTGQRHLSARLPVMLGG